MTWLLILAAALWGFGFVAVKWMLPVWDPMSAFFLRFLLASLIMLPYFIYKKSWTRSKLEYKYSLGAGLLLALAQLTQTWGLKYTTSAKSGFITALYVLVVPIVLVFQKNKIPMRFWMYCLSALGGIVLLGNLDISSFNRGDFLSFCVLSFLLFI